MHASIVSAVMDVGWSWKSNVDSIMGPATTPSGTAPIITMLPSSICQLAGSVLDFDAGCNFGCNAFHCHDISVQCVAVHSMWLSCLSFWVALDSLALDRN